MDLSIHWALKASLGAKGLFETLRSTKKLTGLLQAITDWHTKRDTPFNGLSLKKRQPRFSQE